MKNPKSYEEISEYILKGKVVLLFTADWCGDCHYIAPFLPELEKEFSAFRWLQIKQENFPVLYEKWNIYGIPSLVVFENGKEIDRLVNKKRKTKAEIELFLLNL